jgi:integrase
VDARSPPVQPVQVFDGVTALLSHRRVLLDLRHRWPAGTLTRRARPRTLRPAKIADIGSTHLQFEALFTAARESSNTCGFALVAMFGLLGLRIFEAIGADITDLGKEHGHRVLRVCGKGTEMVLIPLPPAVGRAIDEAIGARAYGPILLNRRGARMDRHAATRRLRRLAETAGVRITRPHPHMLRHTLSRPCSMLASTSGMSRSAPGTLIRAPRCGTTGHVRTSSATPTTSSPAYMASGI